MPSSENFGQRLKDLRKKAGISQKDLAGRIGVSPPNLSQWEGMAVPPLEGIMKVCNHLGIPLGEFFRDESMVPGGPHPPWMLPEHLAFLKALTDLPPDVQKQLIEHFTGILSMRKII